MNDREKLKLLIKQIEESSASEAIKKESAKYEEDNVKVESSIEKRVADDNVIYEEKTTASSPNVNVVKDKIQLNDASANEEIIVKDNKGETIQKSVIVTNKEKQAEVEEISDANEDINKFQEKVIADAKARPNTGTRTQTEHNFKGEHNTEIAIKQNVDNTNGNMTKTEISAHTPKLDIDKVIVTNDKKEITDEIVRNHEGEILEKKHTEANIMDKATSEEVKKVISVENKFEKLVTENSPAIEKKEVVVQDAATTPVENKDVKVVAKIPENTPPKPISLTDLDTTPQPAATPAQKPPVVAPAPAPAPTPAPAKAPAPVASTGAPQQNNGLNVPPNTNAGNTAPPPKDNPPGVRAQNQITKNVENNNKPKESNVEIKKEENPKNIKNKSKGDRKSKKLTYFILLLIILTTLFIFWDAGLIFDWTGWSFSESKELIWGNLIK